MEPHRKEPVAMDSMTQVEGPIHLGLDVAKNAIVVGVLLPGRDGVDVDRIGHDEASVRRLVDRFPDRGRLRVCYEAGPTGFGLYRLLASMGVACEGRCCIGSGWTGVGGFGDAFDSSRRSSHDVVLRVRRLPVPTGCDRSGGAVVLTVRAVV